MEIELEHEEHFRSFLQKHLKAREFDFDAYLERLITHWGETGEEVFTLPPEETASGEAVSLSFAVGRRYFIREGKKLVPVENLDEGYDTYLPVLSFPTDTAAEPEETAPAPLLNPMALLRHRAGKSLRDVAERTGIEPETLIAYEQPGRDMGQMPLGDASKIAKALGVHAEALLTCAPAEPRKH
jgi:hypothetical protein